MVRVGENQLQAVCAEGQRDQRLRLSQPEMQVLEIIRDPLIERAQSGVDQQMVVTGIALSKPAGATPIPVSPKRIRVFRPTTSPLRG